MIRRAVTVLGLALFQATLTIALTVFVFGSNMSRWDSGAETPASIHLANAVVTVLAMPALPLMNLLPKELVPSGFPWDHMVFFANGVFWAVAVLCLRRLWLQRHGSSSK
jgi:hypothetical protein